MKITLNKIEYKYLHNAPFLSDSWQKTINLSCDQKDNSYIINISEEQSDELRDILGERLQIVGFDKEYKITMEGQILESLVDKLFID